MIRVSGSTGDAASPYAGRHRATGYAGPDERKWEFDVDLSLATREVDGRTVIAVGGEIDVYTAPKLRDQITELVAGGHLPPRHRHGRPSSSSTPPASACWSAA